MEMIKIELPESEWVKMERNHEIIEEFQSDVSVYGFDEAMHILHETLHEISIKED